MGRYASALPFFLSTAFPHPPIAGIAGPIVAGVTKVGVDRYHEGCAQPTASLVTPFASPVVARGGEVAVLRHFDRDARTVVSEEPATAFPVSSRSREIGMQG